MARLYWRVKKNGKWTWTPATTRYIDDGQTLMVDEIVLEEEE